MRALIFLLPLSLAAADAAGLLDDAVARWSSDSADEREAASRAVVRHLQQELAPLLDALRSDDPEVRRRARTAIEALLPPREEPAPTAEAEAGVGQLRVVVRAAQGGAGQVIFVQQALAEHPALKAKGITGQPAEDPLLRAQLGIAEGRGFAVTGVDEGSEAARLGLAVHDILLSIGGSRVMTADEVAEALAAPAGELRLLRGGKVLSLGATGPEGAAGEGK